MIPALQKGNCSTIQSDAVLVQNWSHEKKLRLNTEKCKEMIIDFKKQKHSCDRNFRRGEGA